MTHQRAQVLRGMELETSMLTQVLTYAVVAILIFFVMGGYLPVSGTRVSSLAETTSAADSTAGQLFQAGAWSLALVMMLPHVGAVLQMAGRMKFLLCLTLLALASTAWSQDPSTTFRRAIFLLLGAAFCFYLVRRFSAEQLAQIIVIAGVCAGVLGILVSVLLPQYGRDTFNGGAWQGIFRSKNGCAQIMLFLLTPALAFRFRSRGMQCMRLLLFPVTVLLLVMSQAKTSWLLAPLLFFMMAMLGGMRRFRRRDATFLAVLAAGTAAIACLAIPWILPTILDLLGKDPSLSGRTPLWTASLLSILKRPLLGYGFAAFWTGLKGESLNVFMSTHFEIYNAQNGLLEVWLELGLAGVVLVVLTLLQAARDALICLRHQHSRAVNWYIGIVVLSLAYNVDESFFTLTHSLPWLLYTVACAGLALEASRVRAASQLPTRPLRTAPAQGSLYAPVYANAGTISQR